MSPLNLCVTRCTMAAMKGQLSSTLIESVETEMRGWSWKIHFNKLLLAIPPCVFPCSVCCYTTCWCIYAAGICPLAFSWDRQDVEHRINCVGSWLENVNGTHHMFRFPLHGQGSGIPLVGSLKAQCSAGFPGLFPLIWPQIAVQLWVAPLTG